MYKRASDGKVYALIVYKRASDGKVYALMGQKRATWKVYPLLAEEG
jgi:hypothetical protein